MPSHAVRQRDHVVRPHPTQMRSAWTRKGLILGAVAGLLPSAAATSAPHAVGARAHSVCQGGGVVVLSARHASKFTLAHDACGLGTAPVHVSATPGIDAQSPEGATAGKTSEAPGAHPSNANPDRHRLVDAPDRRTGSDAPPPSDAAASPDAGARSAAAPRSDAAPASGAAAPSHAAAPSDAAASRKAPARTAGPSPQVSPRSLARRAMPSLRRALALAPEVDTVARAHDIDPLLLHAIAHVESRHDATAVSPAGALGVMQVMPATGRRFGVGQAGALHDARTNLHASAAYLKFLQRRFDNDLRLVLAGYNAGEGAVERHGRRLPPYRETQRYVADVLDQYDRLLAAAARLAPPADAATSAR